MRQFVVPEPLIKYTGANAIRELDTVLKENAENTQVVRVSKVDQVLLNADALVVGKYRFTASALQEFLNTAVPRLGPAIRNLYLEGIDDSSKTVQFTAEWVNHVTRRRFSRLRRHQLVIDSKRRHIVGFVGPRYRRLCNFRFMEQVKDACAGLPDRPRLFEATLKGRKLSVACVGSSRFQSGDVQLCRGVFAQNGETGDRAVRLANLVFVLRAGKPLGYAVSGFHADTRVPHISGRKFDEKLAIAFDCLSRYWTDEKKLASRVSQLKAGKLVSASDLKKRDVSDIRRTTIVKLKNNNVFGPQAAEVADRVVRPNVSISPWDLVEACLHVASDQTGDQTVALRQFVYSMLC